MPTYSALFEIDQPGGSGSGSPGQANLVLWLSTRVNLTPTQAPPAAQYEWKMTAPKGSVAVFLDPATDQPNARCAAPYFIPDVWGSYLIQLTINNGLYTCQLVAAIKFDQNGALMKFGWRYPALQESLTAASDDAGWKQAIEDIFDSIYGILSSLEEHGGQSGSDGGDARAADLLLQAERRLRLHEYNQTVRVRIGETNHTYTVKQVYDQKRFIENYVSLVAYNTVDVSEGPHLTVSPALYGLARGSGPAEQLVSISALADLMGSYYADCTPYSLAVYGTLIAVSLSTAVVVFDFATASLLNSSASVSIPMQIITNPDGGAGFGRDCRMAFGIDRGVPRIYLTDNQTNKIYSARVGLPITFTAASTQVVVAVTADIVWTSYTADAPQGITIDDANNVWVALTGSDALAKFSVTTPDLDHVVLTLNKAYSVAEHPTELIFDGVYVVATHSWWPLAAPSPTPSWRCSWVAVASGMQQNTDLQVCTPDGTLLPLPVAYGPGCLAFDGQYVWLAGMPTLTTSALTFTCMLPVRFSPSDGSAVPGWPWQEFADSVYNYLTGVLGGAPTSIVMTPQSVSSDGCGGIYAAFQLLEGPVTVQHVLRTLPSVTAMETDTLAVRGAIGVLVAVAPGTLGGLGTQASGAGAVTGLIGTNNNDVVLWSTDSQSWTTGQVSGGGDATSLRGVALSTTPPTVGQALKGVQVGPNVVWTPATEGPSGVASVGAGTNIVVTGTDADPVVNTDPNPTFESIEVAVPGFFSMGPAPLSYGDVNYDNVMGSGTGVLVVNSTGSGSFEQLKLNNSYTVPDADGAESWSAALLTATVGGTTLHATMYFRDQYLLTPSDLIAWVSSQSGGAVIPTVDLWCADIWTAEGATADYTWSLPAGTAIVNPFPDPPAFDYFGSTAVEINETAATLNVPLQVRQVTDAGMAATAGMLAEIVYNTADNMLYQCLTTGAPASWARLSPPSLSTYYTPDFWGPWTDIRTAAPRGFAGAVIRVAGIYYSYGDYNGGTPTNKIYMSEDGIVWTDSGEVCPAATYSSYLAIIGDTIWFCGNNAEQTYIWTAPLSNPLAVSDTGHTLPGRGETQQVVTDTKIIRPCGHGSSGGFDNVAIADISDPTTWAVSTTTVYGGIRWQCGVVLAGDTVYIVGGSAGQPSGDTKILTVSARTGQVSGYYLPVGTLPYNTNNVGPALHIGNRIICPAYCQGSRDVLSFDPNNPAYAELRAGALPVDFDSAQGQYWILPDGSMIAHDRGYNQLWRSGRIKLTGPTQAPGSVAPIQCWTDNGQSMLLTTTVQRGFLEQYCSGLTAF